MTIEEWRAACGIPEIPADPEQILAMVRQGQLDPSPEFMLYMALRNAAVTP